MALIFNTLFNVTTTIAVGTISNSITVDLLPVGCLAIVTMFYDNTGNAGSDPVVTVNDNGNNVWTVRSLSLFDPGAVSLGCVIKTFTSRIVVPPTSLNITNSTSTVMVGFVSRVTSDIGGNINFVAGGTSVGSSTTLPTVTSTSIAVNNLIIAFGGKKDTNTWVADSDTLNGSWTGALTSLSNTGVASTSQSSIIQSKIVNAAGTQTYNPTFTPAAITNLTWLQISETPFITKRFGLLGVG